jgi:thymidylate synthase
MALPPCHLLYQFIVRPLTIEQRLNYHITLPGDIKLEDAALEKYFSEHIPKFYLDLNMYQRSCDTFLGVPFNIASMSLLLHIFAKVSNMIPGVATWIGGDTHLYVDHIPMVKDQLSRQPYRLPSLEINKELRSLEDILDLQYEDFQLNHYAYHPSIKAELFTGIKK